jgi:hypothetical protein
MESTLQKPTLVAAKTTPKAKTIVYFYAALMCPERFLMRARGARTSRARGYRRSR